MGRRWEAKVRRRGVKRDSEVEGRGIERVAIGWMIDPVSKVTLYNCITGEREERREKERVGPRGGGGRGGGGA